MARDREDLSSWCYFWYFMVFFGIYGMTVGTLWLVTVKISAHGAAKTHSCSLPV